MIGYPSPLHRCGCCRHGCCWLRGRQRCRPGRSHQRRCRLRGQWTRRCPRARGAPARWSPCWSLRPRATSPGQMAPVVQRPVLQPLELQGCRGGRGQALSSCFEVEWSGQRASGAETEGPMPLFRRQHPRKGERQAITGQESSLGVKGGGGGGGGGLSGAASHPPRHS